MKRFPQVRRPRWRYRKARHLQDTVVLELHVPASMIPWLENWSGWFGPGVERVAIFFLTSHLMQMQEAMWKGAWGGRKKHARILKRVREFLVLPTNCGPPKVTVEDAIGPTG